MSSDAPAHTLTIGEWRADLRTGRLTSEGRTRAVEPKVMDLLFLLASRPGEVFSKDEILERLWPNVTVGEDTLARSISKLRKALGDDPAASRYVETIPKRGYRLVQPADGRAVAASPARPFWRRWWPAAVGVVVLGLVVGLIAYPRMALRDASRTTAAELTSRGDDAYFQFTRADNEAAVDFYERALAADADHPRALAGLANATVQTVIRWPAAPGRAEIVNPNLAEALAKGRTRTPEARANLARARGFAERAVRLAPEDAATLKALGFVRSAQGEFDGSLETYRRALTFDRDAWAVMINIGDVLSITGKPREALPWFEKAYAAMSRSYDREALRVRPWQAELGVAIARRHAELGQAKAAAGWYRRVLSQAPLHPAATAGLAKLLADGGDRAGARRLCQDLVDRTGQTAGCAPYV